MRAQWVKQTTLMSIDRVTNRKWFSSHRERTVIDSVRDLRGLGESAAFDHLKSRMTGTSNSVF